MTIELIIFLSLIGIEILLRIIPTKRNLSIVDLIMLFINYYVPNYKKTLNRDIKRHKHE